MARKAVINREKRKIKTCNRYRDRYLQVKEQLRLLQKEPEQNYDEIQKLYKKFRKMPRNASVSRIRRRCSITGRSRGVYRKFGLSRHMLRLLAMRGEIPGITKSSW